MTARDASRFRLVLAVARLELSPGRLTWKRLRIGGGVAFEAGELWTHGDGAIVPISPVRERAPWFALSERVRVDIRIRRGWYSEIGVSLLQPIVPDYFADFNDTNQAYKMPALGFASALAIGYRSRRAEAQ